MWKAVESAVENPFASVMSNADAVQPASGSAPNEPTTAVMHGVLCKLKRDGSFVKFLYQLKTQELVCYEATSEVSAAQDAVQTVGSSLSGQHRRVFSLKTLMAL
jgi:hypothetical protein